MIWRFLFVFSSFSEAVALWKLALLDLLDLHISLQILLLLSLLFILSIYQKFFRGLKSQGLARGHSRGIGNCFLFLLEFKKQIKQHKVFVSTCLFKKLKNFQECRQCSFNLWWTIFRNHLNFSIQSWNSCLSFPLTFHCRWQSRRSNFVKDLVSEYWSVSRGFFM